MAITSLALSPEIAAVGQAVTVAPVGAPAPDTDLRYYLLSAPPSSSLLTLATYEDAGKALADARLKVKANGQAEFTPDVPGQYKVVVREVSVYRFIPSYGGEVPATGDPRAADNEEAAYTVDGVTTPQVSNVPTSGATLWTYETLSRAVGFGQDTATLAVKVYGTRVPSVDYITNTVTLTPGATAPARSAVYDADVEAVLDEIRAITSNGHQQLALHAGLIYEMVFAFNEHLGLDNFKTHTTVADPTTDALASTADVAATVAAVQTRLNDIVAKYNAHRVRLTDPVTSGALHTSADATNVMTVQPCSTEAEAIAYAEHVFAKLQAHGMNAVAHNTTPVQRVVDGYFGWLAEPPRSIAEVAAMVNGTSTSRWAYAGLTALYEAHRQRSTSKVHATAESLAPDTANTVLYLDDSLSSLIGTANALADALNRHVQNLDATGSAAATPYHYAEADRSRLVRTRANDIRSLAVLVEELWICLESHLWSAGPPTGYVAATTSGSRGQHPDRAFGYYALLGHPSSFTRPMLMIRLAKAFDRALVDDTATSSAVALGYLATLMRRLGGFS